MCRYSSTSGPFGIVAGSVKGAYVFTETEQKQEEPDFTHPEGLTPAAVSQSLDGHG